MPKISRKPTDLCMICKERHSDKKNSHIIPALVSKTVIGKRYSEKSYAIDTGSGSLDKYYGRSVISEEHPGIKQNHSTLDYIFCTLCEKKLGVLESKIGPSITHKLFDNKFKERFDVITINDFDIIHFNNLHQIEYSLFFQSIIWRMHIQQAIEKNDFIISKEHSELIRMSLKDSFYNSSCHHINNLMTNYSFSILIQRENEHSTSYAAFPPLNYDYPLAFFVHHFMVYIYNNTSERKFDPLRLVSNSINTPPRALLIPENKYREHLNCIIKEVVIQKFFNGFVNFVFQNTSLSKQDSHSRCLECFQYDDQHLDSFERIENCKQKLLNKYSK